MKFYVLPVTPYEQNCSIWICETSNHAVVVDPGGDPDRIMAVLKKLGENKESGKEFKVEKVLLTHGHIDHASAARELAQRLGVSIEGPHEADAFLLNDLPGKCAAYGWPVYPLVQPDRWLKDGDVVSFGDQVLEVIHCPGHTPGQVAFYHRPSQLAAVGDILFAGSIGRSDFTFNGKPYGDFQTLVHAIRSKLWPLGNEVEFIPGHGPNSTFGRERQSNPFVADDARQTRL